MKLKVDEDGHVVVKDGMPVYEVNGKETPFDAPQAVAKIKEQAETLDDLERSSSASTKELEKELKAWQRLGDLAEVRKAVKTVTGLQAEDIDAAQMPAELEQLRSERDALQEQLNEASEEIKASQTEIRTLSIGNRFGTEPWIRENLIDAFANDPATLEKIYGDNFKREGGKVVAYGKDGKPLLVVDPETNSPRPASFAEALNVLVPDTFRKPSGAKGSDATSDSVASAGTGNGSIKTKADLKNPVEKAKYISDHGLEAFQQLPSGAAK
jgi:hypothetical protein